MFEAEPSQAARSLLEQIHDSDPVRWRTPTERQMTKYGHGECASRSVVIKALPTPLRRARGLNSSHSNSTRRQDLSGLKLVIWRAKEAVLTPRSFPYTIPSCLMMKV